MKVFPANCRLRTHKLTFSQLPPHRSYSRQQIFDVLENGYEKFCSPTFIPNDPISIPHLFSKKQDIEIMGFWAAMLAWGQRKTIISKCQELLALMDNEPYDFILHHQPKDLKRFLQFKHRTFNATDTLYFLDFFKRYYAQHDSLEIAFSQFLKNEDENVGNALTGFHHLFFDNENAPKRTWKHVATPERNSACKRLNMFLRWMVRDDDKGVDFGIWKNIQPSQLLCPLDVHVDRVARKFGLLQRKQTDWKATLELTSNLGKHCPEDPVKYDFALFGIGVLESQSGITH